MIKELLLGSGALGLAYLLKRQYDKKLEQAFDDGANSQRLQEIQWKQRESKEDRQIIYQGGCAKGTLSFDGRESFEWDSEGLDDEGNPPEWHGYVVRVLSDTQFLACLARAYASRYGYVWGEGCRFVHTVRLRYTDCFSKRDIGWAATFVARMDKCYTLARESYLIGCDGIMAFMDTKKAMDSWYLAQRARFLATYDVSMYAYNFHTHPLPYTLLELDLQRERSALLHDKGSKKQRFFTNAMALYELHHKEWDSRYRYNRGRQYLFLDTPSSPKYEMDCWYQICKDIWEGKGFMHYVKEEEDRAKEMKESKDSEFDFYEDGVDY